MDKYKLLDLENTLQIIDSIRKKSGRSDKEEILSKYRANKLFVEILKFVYNPLIVTGISSKKMNKSVKKDDISAKYKDKIQILSSIEEVMQYLKENNTGRDVDIYNIQQFVEAFNENDKEILKEIITKSLKIGITGKTINKIYGKNTIPIFSVMLAEPLDKYEESLDEEFYITLKLDGTRIIAIVDDSEVEFFTRQGKSVSGLSELKEQLSSLPNGVYDGEVLLKNDENLNSDDLFRATQKVLRKDGEKKGLIFYIFDLLSISEFINGKSSRTYSQRRNLLDTSISEHSKDLSNVEVLSVLYKGDDKSIIPLILQQVEAEGLEGIMINVGSGLYESKRTKNLLKVKSMSSADLLVMSLEEGTGKNKGKLGRINVEYKGGLTGVGSGFTDEDREHYWNNPNELAGKIVEVQFFRESIDEKTKQPSLRFPVFKCVRDDKGVEDIRYE